MSAWSPKSTAALIGEQSRADDVIRLLRTKGYRDVTLISVEERNADVIEALFTVPQVTATGLTKCEARRAWICRASGSCQILSNWDVTP